MSRFLFVFPPLVGHVNPAVGVADELVARGHEVAWVAHADVVGAVIGEGATIFPAGDAFIEGIIEHLPEREELKGLAALKFLWTRVLLPLAIDMVPHVRTAVDEFRPDVIVSDQQTFAGAVVAEERGLPWGVSACGTADLIDTAAMLPKVARWMTDQVTELCAALGKPELAARGFDPRYSPQLILEYSTRDLVGPGARDIPSLAFVGPILPRWADEVAFPWDWLERFDDHVYVSLGTLSQGIGDRFLGAVLEAVAGKPYGVVMIGAGATLPPPPDNVLLCDFVPQLTLVPRMKAVLCHGGHNTTVGTLAEGIPLIVAPIRDDQPIIADMVARSGAGVRLNFVRAKAPAIADALDAVLYTPSYREAAGRIARSFEAGGGAPAAADQVEKLVGSLPAYTF